MDITPKYTEIVGINWFRSNFIEFKKVIDIVKYVKSLQSFNYNLLKTVKFKETNNRSYY